MPYHPAAISQYYEDTFDVYVKSVFAQHWFFNRDHAIMKQKINLDSALFLKKYESGELLCSFL